MFVYQGLFAEQPHPIIYPFFMQANNFLISRLEKLARLKLEPAEKVVLTNDLDQILKMVDKLLELDTAEVEPLAYPTISTNQYRTDEVQANYSQTAALKNAPNHNDQFFQVPKVIE